MTQHQLIQCTRKNGKFLSAGSKLILATDNFSIAEQHEIKSLAPEANSRQRWLKITTSDPDRAGDIITTQGADTTNFERNPQFLWQHGLTNEAVHTIGRIVKLVNTHSAIYALAEYATADESSLAERIFKMDDAGLLPANSIGFSPIEWEPNEYGGITFTKWELIEVSKVELPCNPYAIDDGAPKSLSLSQAALLI
ncbi:MAG TPA: hypothetical protein VEW28_10620 [Candidatus Kapabacteria bacterium]|nr:hypothetical protein [Candidatus Kapabacteria bacterium]